MSFYGSTDALYGTGTFGSASYGVVAPTVSISGAAATGSVQSVAINGFEIDLSERLGSVQANASVSTLGVGIKKTVDSVQATLTANSVGVGASETLGSVEAVTANNTVTVNVTEKPRGVIASAFLSDYALNLFTGITVRTINRINVSGVAATSSLGSIEAKTTEDLLSVSATGQIGSLGVSVTKEVSSTDATLHLTAPKPNLTLVPTSVVATSALTPTVQQTNQPVEGVSATGQVNTIGISRVFQIGSVSSVTALNRPSATGFKFDYNAVRFQYSARRTVLVDRAA